ncbi:hypothetical protein BCM0075_5085 [Bacillus cereus]|nr:hypothetical protein BCM0075_5085 [Bacillus cereus]
MKSCIILFSKIFKQHKHTVYVVFNLSEMNVSSIDLKKFIVG